MKHAVGLSVFAIFIFLLPAEASLPWGPEAACKLNPARPEGLHPGALSALRELSAAHRITQGINHAATPGNVHDTDGTLGGKPYTGAVDISVRCLSGMQIQSLLGRLAELGFAAWYRKDGQDDWAGPPHIHAVWAGCRLKTVLQKQVESWLAGKNGLGAGRRYRFWQASATIRETVRRIYTMSN